MLLQTGTPTLHNPFLAPPPPSQAQPTQQRTNLSVTSQPTYVAATLTRPPSGRPTLCPTAQPSAPPTTQSTTQPTLRPTSPPTTQSTAQPTVTPTAQTIITTLPSTTQTIVTDTTSPPTDQTTITIHCKLPPTTLVELCAPYTDVQSCCGLFELAPEFVPISDASGIIKLTNAYLIDSFLEECFPCVCHIFF